MYILLLQVIIDVREKCANKFDVEADSVQVFRHRHISLQAKNQEEIFRSLSKQDFKKIVSNLNDDSLKLRQVSLKLITALLFNSSDLQLRFCAHLGIHPTPNRIVLNGWNFRTPKQPKKILQIIKAIKAPLVEPCKDLLFWYMELTDKVSYKLKHVYKDKQAFPSIDPANCIVGFIIEDQKISYKSFTKASKNTNKLDKYSKVVSMINQTRKNNSNIEIYAPTGALSYKKESFNEENNQKIITLPPQWKGSNHNIIVPSRLTEKIYSNRSSMGDDRGYFNKEDFNKDSSIKMNGKGDSKRMSEGEVVDQVSMKFRSGMKMMATMGLKNNEKKQADRENSARDQGGLKTAIALCRPRREHQNGSQTYRDAALFVEKPQFCMQH